MTRRGRSVVRCTAILACALGVAASAPPAVADRPLTTRFSANVPGDLAMIGNATTTCATTVPPAANQAAVNSCLAAQAGGGGVNNNFQMVAIDIDGDPATTSSSSARLSLPAGATVQFAGLYWGGHRVASDTARYTVKLKAPGEAAYAELTAQAQDVANIDSNAYSGFVDVTERVREAGAGVYTVADVRANSGAGPWGAWSLAVAYRDPGSPPRNLTVIDGFVLQSNNNVTVSGFTTPPSGPVRTTLGVMAFEGDRGFGDSFAFNGQAIRDAANPAGDFFNSTVSRFGLATGERTPSYSNNLGIDIDFVDATGLIGNSATSATLRFSSGTENYFVNAVTFVTDLFAPKITAEKTVENLTRPGGPAQRGDRLRYALEFENSAATGTDAAAGFVLRDSIPEGTTYAPGSLRIVSGSGAPASPSDAAGDDLGEVASGRAVFRLGDGASSSEGGRLEVGASTSVSFEVTVDQDAQPGQDIVNEGSFDYRAATLGTGFTGVETNTVRTPVVGPDLTISKTHDLAFTGGARTRFTLIAANVGSAPTTGAVTISDTFPSGAAGFEALENAQGDGWSCDVAGLTLTCTRADALAAGESYAPIYVDAIVNPSPLSFITNTATVSGGGDVNPANNAATDSGGTGTVADVSIVKTTGTPTLEPGERAAYTLEVRNAGPSTAADVTVTDTLPGADYAGVTATSTTGTCTTAVACTIGSLAPGETAEISIGGEVLGNDVTLVNSATVDTTTDDPDPSNDSDEAEVVVQRAVDLAVVKAAAAPTAAIGSPFSYTIDVENKGPLTATDVVVTDPVPSGFSGAVASGAGWSCAGAPVITCTRASLAPGPAPAITVTGTPTPALAGESFVNTATVGSFETDLQPNDNTHSAGVVGGTAADLLLDKSVNAGSPVNPGAGVTFTLSVTNNGPSPAADAGIEDTFPANLTPQSLGGANAADCQIAGQQVDCAFGSLAVGDSRTVTVNATVGGIGDEVLTNTALATSSTPDTNEANNTDDASVDVTPSADLSLVKDVSDPAPAPGDQVVYTLVARNDGPSPANAVTIEDELPVGLTYVSDNQPECTGAGRNVSCLLPAALAPAGSFSVEVTAAVADSAAGATLRNTASVTAAAGPHDPDPTDNEASAAIDVEPLADLRIEKSQPAASPRVDSVRTYTLTVTNDGPNDAEAVVVTDPLPVGTHFLDASGGCTQFASQITCALGTVLDGQTVERTITVQVMPALAGAALTNSAEVSAATVDPQLANNSDGVAAQVDEQVDLRLTKTASRSDVPVGETVTYTLVVANRGPSDATAVELEDPAPAGLEPVGATPTQGSCSIAGQTTSCALGGIAADGGAQVLVTARVASRPAGGELVNTATVAAAEPEARTVDNRDSAAVTAQAVQAPPPAQTAGLRISKAAGGRSVRVGERLRYTIRVTNDGPAAAQDVVVTDTPGGGLETVRVTPSQGSCSGDGPIVCRLGTLASARSATVTLVARVTRTGRVVNAATVVAANGTGDATRVTTRSRPQPVRISIGKRASAERVRSGATVGYRITVRSRGPGTARNARVCDLLPRQLTVVSLGGGRIEAGKRICWRIRSLRPGRTRTFRIRLRVERRDATRRITNTAVVRAPGAPRRRARATVTALPVAVQRGGGVTG
jgi:large repetitive protein